MDYDMIHDLDSAEDLAAAVDNAKTRLTKWKMRSLYSLGALFTGCSSVVPFLSGHPLHAYWGSIGKYLVLVSMGLLIVAVYCNGLLWGAWTAFRELQKK